MSVCNFYALTEHSVEDASGGAHGDLPDEFA